MPRSRAATKATDAETIHIAVETFFAGCEDGSSVFVRAGDRLRGDHELVRRLGPYFTRDGEGADGRLKALTKLAGTPAAPPALDPEPEQVRHVRATKPITATISVPSTSPNLEGGFNSPFENAMVTVAVGNVLSSDNEIVGMYPDAFEAVKD
jgi:hypothetical protein